MKPIKLIISGFNSFIEKQVIDFTSITSHGIFGIFGPTGSGKSSILDAITFSLYGKIDRGDGIFVNTNCKSAFVSFSFLIKEDIFEIERMITSKNGSYKTKSIKMIKNNEIIGQKDREIEKILYDEVLGLTYNDFITSVVLPQGKFSEFLSATPKDRRGLIERLFDLKKYGSDLSLKIKKFKDNLELNYANLQGEFKSFDGVDENELEDMKNSYEKKILEKEKIKKEIIDFNDEYMKAQNLWIINNEMKTLNEELKELILDNSDINKEEKRLNDYRLVKEFLPVKKQIIKITDELNGLKDNKQNYEKEIIQFTDMLHNANLKQEKLSNQKLNDIPNLNKECEKLEKEVLLLEEKESLQVKLSRFNKILQSSTDDLLRLQEQNENYTTEIRNINIELIEKEKSLKENEISEIYLERILKASEKEKNVNRLSKSLRENEEYLLNLKENKKRLQMKFSEFESESNGLKNTIEENEKQIEKFDSEIDKGREEAALLTNQEDSLKTIKEKWVRLLEAIEANKEEISKKEDEINGYISKKEVLEEELKSLEQLKNANRANEAIKILLPILRSEKKCPLCGANEPFNEEIQIKDLSYDDSDFDDKQREISNLNNMIIINETQIKSLKEDYLNLNDELSLISKDLFSLENLNNIILNLNQKSNGIKNKLIEYQMDRAEIYNRNLNLKKFYEESISNLHETKGRLRTTEEEIKAKEKENENLSIEFKSCSKDYEEEQRFFKTDLLEKLKEITMGKEKQNRNIRKSITKQTNLLNDLNLKRNKLAEDLNETKLSSLRLKDEIGNINKRYSEINLNLKYKTKEELNKKLLEVKGIIEDIEKKYIEITDKIKRLESLKQEKVSLSENLKGIISVKESLLKDSQKSLVENLNKLNLEEDIEKYELSLEDELFLERKINGFKKKHEILNQKITNLEEKTKGTTITEEKWKNLNEKKENLEFLKTKIEEETGALKKEIEINTSNLLKAKELKVKIDALLKKKEIVDEIQSLTKGNSIMDFVAYKQLKYISNIASNTLSNITGTRYNIIIDETGDFMIRDLLNGGEKRKIRSLSGGELFLTSLSMALALSSHIQLKGKMCLEFFFLDEGFGTLDKNSLEIVLRALERIKNNNLTIGIISHLKEIQERMPVKIMVTPANTDHGSIVKIV